MKVKDVEIGQEYFLKIYFPPVRKAYYVAEHSTGPGWRVYKRVKVVKRINQHFIIEEIIYRCNKPFGLMGKAIWEVLTIKSEVYARQLNIITP